MQVRRGVTRTVFLISRYAVKVPSLRGMGPHGATLRGRLASLVRGIQANQSENVWSSFEPWQGRVAPVLRSWVGGIVQVYRRCQPLPRDYQGPLPQLRPCPGDLKAANFGLLDGQVVRVDYDMTGPSCAWNAQCGR